jgi:hypothetical protein
MLTDQDYKDAAAKIGCDVAAVKAVTYTESGRKGFYDSGKCIIKYEGHVFHRLTGGKYDAAHPTLSYPAWTEKYSQFKDLAYVRFNQAFALDPHAAMMSTSWGMFQIMGENFSSCGFKTVDDFVTSMRLSEAAQLNAFCKFVISRGLAKYLIGLKTLPGVNASGFALRYNGAGYKANDYDTQIIKFYRQFSQPA